MGIANCKRLYIRRAAPQMSGTVATAASAIFAQSPLIHTSRCKRYSHCAPSPGQPSIDEGGAVAARLPSDQLHEAPMSLSRRRFFAYSATAIASAWLPAIRCTMAAETHVISWPSRVVQLPPDDDDQKPPVVTAVRL